MAAKGKPCIYKLTGEKCTEENSKGSGKVVQILKPKIITAYGPRVFNCGHVEWYVRFTLPEPAQEDGWLVQRVTLTSRFPGKKLKHKSYAERTTYYEAWEIKKGKTAPVSKDSTFGSHDTYAVNLIGTSYSKKLTRNITNDWTKSKGTLAWDGMAVFFAGIELPKSFKTGNIFVPCAAQAMPASTCQPDFWTEAGTSHSLRFDWDCTNPKDRKFKVMTVPQAKPTYPSKGPAKAWRDPG